MCVKTVTFVVAVANSMIPNDGIPKPAVVLFSPEKVLLEWKTTRGVGVGLRNNNNNCYLNSVLQCLTYSPPLVNYLYSNDHTYSCEFYRLYGGVKYPWSFDWTWWPNR